jgi:hypothetical protein
VPPAVEEEKPAAVEEEEPPADEAPPALDLDTLFPAGPEEPGDAAGDQQAAAPEPAPPDAEPFELPVRRSHGPARPVAWLGAALGRLGATEPERAARVLFAGLAMQSTRVSRPFAYDLHLEGYEARRVRVAPGGAFEVLAVPDAPEPPAFGLEGGFDALVPLAAGGVARRRARALPGARVTGRRRHLRRLLQALREPAGLDDLAAAGPRLEPVDLLALAAAAIPPAAAASHAFAVGFDAGPSRLPAHLRLAGGGPATAGPGIPPDARAIVRVEPDALASFLAGRRAATGTGDPQAVAVLLGLLDAAQGLS